jgi:predicted O-linked N-acetylglucosamine transferase (SPINDLY family)
MTQGRNSGKRHGFKPGLIKNRDNPDKLLKEARILAALFGEGNYPDVDRRVRILLAANPLWGFGWKLLAGTAAMLFLNEDALQASTMAIRYLPGDPEVFSNHGNILKDLGRFPEAIEAYRRAIRLRPDFAVAHNNLGNALKNQGDIARAIESYENALRITPNFIQAYDNLLFAQFYIPEVSNEKILERHRQWDKRFGLPPSVRIRPHLNNPDPEKPLKVGYVSPDLGRHPVGNLLSSVLSSHDKKKFRIYCYSDRLNEDAVSEKLRESCDCWNRTVGIEHHELAEIIRRDGIDILVDLAGHTAGNRLPVFAMKPAPVQVTWIGYPGTTGLKEIDYILLDDTSLRPGEESCYSEKIIRLPVTRFCYEPPAGAPTAAPSPFLKNGYITFGSFNNLAKMTEPVMSLWARILQDTGDSRLLLKAAPLGSDQVVAEITAAFESRGINRNRLLLRGASPHDEMLAEYADMDIALDPFPFTGGLTSCEALWMGVPVITLYGNRPIARQTSGFLKTAGIEGFTAANELEYRNIAGHWNSNRERLEDIRKGLREKMSSSLLCDGSSFTLNLEDAYVTIWTNWCNSKTSK